MQKRSHEAPAHGFAKAHAETGVAARAEHRVQEGALFAQVVVEFHEHGKRAVRKAVCGEFAQLDVLEFREHPAEAFDDFVFEGGEQAFFVAEVVVERTAVQAGVRAQVAHREAVDATFFDERDEGFAQRGARAGDARVALGCGGCSERGSGRGCGSWC